MKKIIHYAGLVVVLLLIYNLFNYLSPNSDWVYYVTIVVAAIVVFITYAMYYDRLEKEASSENAAAYRKMQEKDIEIRLLDAQLRNKKYDEELRLRTQEFKVELENTEGKE